MEKPEQFHIQEKDIIVIQNGQWLKIKNKKHQLHGLLLNTLVDGKTRAVPYPRKGFNCNPEWSLAQGPYVQKAPKELEVCAQPLQGSYNNYFLND